MSVGRLRVAIVGGGIGGLAAANALSQRGIDVRVYEQAEQLAEVGAGVGVAPNGVRMLRRLGLGEAVEGRGSSPAGIRRSERSSARSGTPSGGACTTGNRNPP